MSTAQAPRSNYSLSDGGRNIHPVIACFLAMILYTIIKWTIFKGKMPPGPIGFLGNNRYQMPAVKPWRKFTEWNKRYGSVVSIFLGSTPVIVLGSAEAAWDLLEKRSEIYSSRPRFIVAGEILSDNHRGLMLPNTNELWRRWRKILHNGFHIRKSENYKEIQSLESKVLLQQILADPVHFEQHFQRFAASVVTSVTYGRRVENVSEWIVKENMDSMDYLTSVNIPGKYIVESWPWLLKLPRSLHWFRREPEERKKKDIYFLTYLLNDVKNRMDSGTVPECLASQCLSDMDKIGMTELELAYSVSSPFGAGIETTAGSLSVFMLAMLHFPTVMRKAQAELDSNVGHDRLPEFYDRQNLPYINAIINETLRWRPVAILGGTPHQVVANDVYKGMLIPKGSTIFANFDYMMHNPEMFPEPETFRPERFLKSNDPRLQAFDLPFGFGRRQCPGMHLALNSLFINISRLLWAFDIAPKLDQQGHPVLPDPYNFTNGFNSRPVSFECRITPRNKSVVKCLEAECQEARVKLNAWA